MVYTRYTSYMTLKRFNLCGGRAIAMQIKTITISNVA